MIRRGNATRRYRRLPMAAPMHCVLQGETSRPKYEGTLGDISRGGLMCLLPTKLPVGTAVALEIHARRGSVPLAGRIVWAGGGTDSPIRHGIAFRQELATDPSLHMATLLLIEGDPTAREGMAMLLQQKGFHVLTATDGEEGLVLANRIRPEGIILDLELPGMDGHELLVRLRRHAPTQAIPVLLLTDMGQRNLQDTSRLGVALYLAKPFRPEAFTQAAELLLIAERRPVRVAEWIALG